jgi:hypothetical protein
MATKCILNDRQTATSRLRPCSLVYRIGLPQLGDVRLGCLCAGVTRSTATAGSTTIAVETTIRVSMNFVLCAGSEPGTESKRPSVLVFNAAFVSYVILSHSSDRYRE